MPNPTPQRWTIYDPDTDTTKTLPFNPAEGGLPERVKKITGSTSTQGTAIMFEGNQELPSIPFKGAIQSAEHQKFLDDWFDLEGKVLLTDHLGRRAWVYLIEFKPVPRNRHNNPWSATYDGLLQFLGWADAP